MIPGSSVTQSAVSLMAVASTLLTHQPLGRRAALIGFAAVPSTSPHAASAGLPPLAVPTPDATATALPLAATSIEAEEDEKFSVPAGLANLRLELKLATDTLDEGESTPSFFQGVLRRPAFVKFLGFDADATDARTGQPATGTSVLVGDAVVNRLLPVLETFPASTRRNAAAAFGMLLGDLRQLDELLRTQPPSIESVETQVRVLLKRALAQTEELGSQYYAKGCMVCPEPATAGYTTEQFDNPNLRKLIEVENALAAGRLRRPDSRDEEYARELGFREGELIGGY
jgi:hypothetical protein